MVATSCVSIGERNCHELSGKQPILRTPFPYFGGKQRIAKEVWARFGDVKHYVEPFAGALGVLLNRPQPIPLGRVETVNDINLHICNFWRAVKFSPEMVAEHCQYPPVELDLNARHDFLWSQPLEQIERKLKADIEWHDPKIAALWVWGQCNWIGAGWCTDKGVPRLPNPNRSGIAARMPADESKGLLAKPPTDDDKGVFRQCPSNDSEGLYRQSPLADSSGFYGRNVDVPPSSLTIEQYLEVLQDRLRNVCVMCGDFMRCLTKSRTHRRGKVCGVFLDPPYPTVADKRLYADHDPETATKAREWALDHGDNPAFRIALCGLEGEHQMPRSWEVIGWKSKTGRTNRDKERIWFSPHCLKPDSEHNRTSTVISIPFRSPTMPRTGVNKSQAIRDMLGKMPDSGPTEVAEALKKDGIKVTPNFVSMIKGKMKGGSSPKKGKRAPRATQAANGNITLDAIKNARELVAQLGAEEAKKLVDAVG
jgi:DNA adenine methylase